MCRFDKHFHDIDINISRYHPFVQKVFFNSVINMEINIFVDLRIFVLIRKFE